MLQGSVHPGAKPTPEFPLDSRGYVLKILMAIAEAITPWLAVGGYQGRKICSFSLGMWLLAGCSCTGEWLQWVHVAIRGESGETHIH